MKNTIITFAVLAMGAMAAGCKKVEPETWSVTLSDDGHGKAAASVTTAEVAAAVTITATPAAGYLFAWWTVTGGDAVLDDPSANPATFTMPAANVAIKAIFRLPHEPEMVWVEPGTFTMGSEAGAADPDEKPVHEVTLTKGYRIGKYEVTQAQWYVLMDKAADESPARFTGDNLPIENVRYHEAQEYIARLNAATGKKYALPTEAQWEWAARGGVKGKGYTYSGGNTINYVAWYRDNSGGATHPVGTLQPNELGIYDMSGNVWEWTADWFDFYRAGAQTDPAGRPTPLVDSDYPQYANKVYRGGCFDNPARHSWPSNRGIISPDDLTGDLGLRLVLMP